MPISTILTLAIGLLLASEGTVQAGTSEWSAVGPYAEFPWVNVFVANSSALYIGTAAGVFTSRDGTAWTRMNVGLGLNYNKVRAFVRDPASPSTVYAGTYGGGVFKTSDGLSWEPVNNGLSRLNVQVMAAAPGSPTRIYAGTLGKVFRTTDGGSTWTPLDNGLTDMNITAIAIDPTRPSTIYIGTYSAGVFKSVDDGQSWAKTGLASDSDPSNPGIYALAVDPSSPGIVYAGADRLGIYRSTDAGAHWSLMSDPPGGRSIAIDPKVPSTLYATNSSGLYKSNDRGRTWTKLGNRGGQIAINGEVDPPALYIAAFDFAQSTDGGVTWQTFSPCCYPFEVYQIGGIQGRTRVYAASRGEVFRSDDGAETWTNVTNGLNVGLTNGCCFRSLAVDPSSDATVYVGSSGLARTVDGGATWLKIQNGTRPLSFPMAIAIDPRSSANIYVGLSAEGVFKSSDGGEHWSGTSLAGDVTALAIDPGNPSILYAGTPGRGVFKSIDAGATWTAASSGLSDLGVSSLAIDSVSTVFATTVSGGLFRSFNGGLSWFPVNEGLPALPVYSVAIDSMNPLTLYVGTGGFGVFQSLDGGGHWTPIGLDFTGQFGGLFLSSIVGSSLYAGTETGLFKLTNAATNRRRTPSIRPTR